MDDVIIEKVVDATITAIPLAIAAMIAVYLSRPFFQKEYAKTASKVATVILLMLAYVLTKGSAEDDLPSDADTSVLIAIGAAYFLMKIIAIYLIACYAKSVNRNPYWCFVGVLNFVIAFILLMGGVWRSEKKVVPPSQGSLTHQERVLGLRRMIDNPDTPKEKRAWAMDRLRTIEQMDSYLGAEDVR